MSELWFVVIGSLIFIIVGIFSLPEGGMFWGVRIPAWCEVVLIILSSIVGTIALRAIMRGEGKPKEIKYTDEEVRKARSALDSMYLEKYGTLPEYPEEQDGGGSGESKSAKTQ